MRQTAQTTNNICMIVALRKHYSANSQCMAVVLTLPVPVEVCSCRLPVPVGVCTAQCKSTVFYWKSLFAEERDFPPVEDSSLSKQENIFSFISM